MDIYKYINSHEVAAHCRKIGKSWTPFEMAVIIQHSCHMISEKHAAFRTLMKEFQGMRIEEYEGFREKLLKLIEYEEQTIALFKKAEPNAVYTYKLYLKNDAKPYHDDSTYATYDKVQAMIKENWEWEKISIIVITKTFSDNDRNKIEAYVDYAGNIYSIDSHCNKATRQKWYPDFDLLIDAFNLFSFRYAMCRRSRSV